MKNYKKLSLVTLLSLSSITLGPYNPYDPTDFDDMATSRPTIPTTLETAAQKQRKESPAQPTRPSSAPSRQNPIPTAQTTKPATQHPSTPVTPPVESRRFPTILPLSDRQKFDNAVKALDDACAALTTYQTDLTLASGTAAAALRDYEQAQRDARRWSWRQIAGIGMAAAGGIAAVTYLVTEPRDAGCAVVSALVGLAGGFGTRKSRKDQIKQCDAHEQDPYAEDKMPLTTQLEQLAGVVGEDEKYNNLVTAYNTAYDALRDFSTATIPGADAQKTETLSAAKNLPLNVNLTRTTVVEQRTELEKILGRSSEQN